MSASAGELQGISKCCLSGSLHTGTPKGTVEKMFGDVDTYVIGNNKAKTVLFLTDIFGFDLPNTRLLADEYAESGNFRVLVPNIIQGDAVPHDLLSTIAPLPSQAEQSVTDKAANTARVGVNLPSFLTRNREGVVLPLVKRIAKELKADPQVEKLGAVGFCWGARYAILLAHDDPADAQTPFVDAVVGNHPSFVVVPDEMQKIRKPVWVNVGDADAMMPLAQVEETNKIFEELLKPKGVEGKVQVYPGAVHGFAVRGDLNNTVEKEQKEQSAKATITFFQKHLQ